VGGFILDFDCPAAKLVLELDGSQHKLSDAVEYDHLRSEYLAARGLTVIRFRNHEVMDDTALVLERSSSNYGSSLPHPTLSLPRKRA